MGDQGLGGTLSFMSTLKELFRYHDWAFGRLVAHARNLTPFELDAEFPIGPGSMRLILIHTYECEMWWLSVANGVPSFNGPPDDLGLEELDVLRLDLAARRDSAIATWGDAGLAAGTRYANRAGRELTRRRADLLLHVANHAVHHRAQALNILRRLGKPVPWLDYFAYRWPSSLSADAPEEPLGPSHLTAPHLADLWDHAGRTTDALVDAFRTAGDGALWIKHEIGVGSAGETLKHLIGPEQWWLAVFANEPSPAAEPNPKLVPLDILSDQLTHTHHAYAALIQSESNLSRPVTATVAPNVDVTCAIGDAILQRVLHRTHHHAQLANMLRIAGVKSPGLDYLALLPDERM